MATFLKSLFKPRKAENGTGPGLNRVASLTADRDDHRLELESLARNAEDASLRLAAIERLDRIEWLIPLYESASHRERSFIAQRVAALARDSQQNVAKAKEAFSNPELRQILEQLTASSEDDMEQVSEQTDAAELERLAIEGRTAGLRKAALDLVSEEQALSRIARAAKGRDKTVYQTARQKLHAIRESEAARQRREQGITQLIAAIDEHARTESVQLYEARLDTLKQQWQELGAHASDEQRSRFEQSLQKCHARLADLAAEAASQQAEIDKREQREATLDLLEATVYELRAGTADQGPSISSLDALIKTQENRWLEATRDTSVDRQEQKHYQELMLGLRHYLQASHCFDREKTTLNRLLEQLEALDPEDAKRLRELQQETRRALDEINWPDHFPVPDLIDRARERLGAAREEQKRVHADQKARQAQLRKILDELDKNLEEKVLKTSVRLYKEAQHCFSELDPQHQHSHQARMHLLGKQLQELRDWQGFATRPKQIELCENMEYLASQHMEPEAKAERIKELQHEWRELGGSSDQKLWQRFKQASDRAYAPCHDYFSARLELKHANVHKRQMIIDQLAEFMENINWDQCHWKGVERIQRQARSEWRAAWPVDFRANRPLQKRFDGLMKELDHHLDEERRRNETIKRDLVERARQLVEHEPLSEATQQAKTLQQEWQNVGITRQREDRKMWQAFRQACDAIFARRDQQRDEQHAQQNQARQRGTEILKHLEEVLKTTEPDLEVAQTLIEEFRRLHFSRDARAELLPEFHKWETELTAIRHRLQAESRRAAWLELMRKHAEGSLQASDQPDRWSRYPLPENSPSPLELCIRAEIISGLASPEDDSELRMQLQVNRLADGINRGQSWRDTAEEMDFLIACWCRQPAPGEADDSFGAARQRIESALRQPLD